MLLEEHKSNDCSTEAVFTVLPKNNVPVGSFDNADCNSLSGWARDPDTTIPISIHFYADGPAGTGVFIGSLLANTYRGDLPYDDKNHGFSFPLPTSLKDNQSHQIYIYAIDSSGGENPLLNNSPKEVNCSPPPITYPDLTVPTITASDSSLTPFQAFIINATVKNQGNGSSGATTLRYYRSTDGTITTGDTLIGTNSIPSMVSGATSTQSLSTTAPGAVGTYWVGACVDSVSGESNTGNNCSTAVQITVSNPTHPDLVVQSPSVSDTTLTPGQSFTAYATARNQGSATSASTTLRYYRSTDSTISTSDTQIATDSLPSLSPEGTSAQNATVTAPTTTGTYWVGACVDSVSGETNTGNNCSSGSIINVSEPAPAAPSSLNAQAASSWAINLTWADNANNEDGYRIDRSLNQIDWSTVATPGANATVFQDTGLNANTTYFYRILSYNSGGSSAWSNVASVKTDSTIPSTNNSLSFIPVLNLLLDQNQQTVNTVVSAGQIWMDRNLGASRVATSSTDSEAYGDLYQWGRGTDGHEKRDSGTTLTNATSDTPGHGLFIIESNSPCDWRTQQNDQLWQGVSGINNPCPPGFRLPTSTELDIERASWSSNNSAGAYASPLKLVASGFRYSIDGAVHSAGWAGLYWSCTVNGIYSHNLIHNSGSAGIYGDNRANGYSVRCIKD